MPPTGRRRGRRCRARVAMVSSSGWTSSSSSQSEGRRHLRARPGPHRPGAEDRLVRGVLVEVDEDPLAALLLPPRRGDQVGPAPLQLAGHRHRRRSAPGRTSQRGCEADVDVDARGCRWSSGSRARRARRAGPAPRAAASRTIAKVTPGVGSRSMRSSSACSWSSARDGQTWKPRQPRLTAHTTWARSAATSASEVVPLGVLTDGGLQPVGRVRRAPASGRTTGRRRRWGSAAAAPGAPPIVRISGSATRR